MSEKLDPDKVEERRRELQQGLNDAVAVSEYLGEELELADFKVGLAKRAIKNFEKALEAASHE